MSNQKAERYDQLLRENTAIQNDINRVPQLSIEEQSKIVDINQKYNAENQQIINKLNNQLLQIEVELKKLF